jgi:hypothetical protein
MRRFAANSLIIFWSFNLMRLFWMNSPDPALQAAAQAMPEYVCMEVTWDDNGNATPAALPDEACAALPQ